MTKFGFTKIGVPLKLGHQTSNFLTTHARHMNFSGLENITKRSNLTKFGGTGTKRNEGMSVRQGCQNSNFNHFCWTDEIFRVGKYEEKIKFDKI